MILIVPVAQVFRDEGHDPVAALRRLFRDLFSADRGERHSVLRDRVCGHFPPIGRIGRIRALLRAIIPDDFPVRQEQNYRSVRGERRQ